MQPIVFQSFPGAKIHLRLPVFGNVSLMVLSTLARARQFESSPLSPCDTPRFCRQLCHRESRESENIAMVEIYRV